MKNTWRQQLAQAATSPAALVEQLQLDTSILEAAEQANRIFRQKAPANFIRKISPGDPRDPLLLQILPHARELISQPGYEHDPVGDLNALKAPGVLQKYQGRVLLIVTGACAIHCRYCFRRHYPYADASSTGTELPAALDYIRSDTSIHEVILSGGDPLMLSDEKLSNLIEALNGIAHLKRLRIHSRMPVVLPDRITDAFIATLQDSPLTCSVVIHANHAREIGEQERQALYRLRTAGIVLLNQAVLLRGVNDSRNALAELSETLFEAGVLPYYLHLLDPVDGAAHFDVDLQTGVKLIKELRRILPGYLVPQLVKEQPGEPHKTPAADLFRRLC